MKFFNLGYIGTAVFATILSTNFDLRAQVPSGQLPNQSAVQLPPTQQSNQLPGSKPAAGAVAGGMSGFSSTQPALAANPNSLMSIPAAIKCIHDIQLAAQSDGLLQELLFEEGAAVEKGQLVLTIDERTANAELAVAEKEAEAAAAQAAQDANVQFSKKAAEVSDAEYLESKDLYERMSASLTETRRKQLEAQKARWGIKVAEVDHEKDILAHQISKEKVAAAKVQVDLRKVISPYDGVIVERMRDQGEWVKAGEPILRLVHLKEMRVEANVPVRGASVSLLQNAQIRLHVNINGEDFTRDSHVEFVSPVVEMHTCRIWARVPNMMIAGGWMLREGMEATVDIHFAPTQGVSTKPR